MTSSPRSSAHPTLPVPCHQPPTPLSSHNQSAPRNTRKHKINPPSAAGQPLKILTANVFGLASKFHELQHVLVTSNVDVAVVTETKLTLEKMSLAESIIKGFHAPLRLDRTAHGGGVAVWVKEELAYEHLPMLDRGNHEIVWLSIHLQACRKLVLGAVYRPGSASGHDISLLEHLDSSLDDARRYGSNILLTGDFNVHSEAWLGSTKTTPAGEYMEELCAAHGLRQHVQCPTRGDNMLDLIISDLDDRVSVTALSPIGGSDHVSLLASISTCARRERRTTRHVWRYNHADWGRLRKFYQDANWDKLIGDDPDEACGAVTNKILEGMRQFIPQKRLLTRPSDPSWWTPECTVAVRAKHNSWKRLQQHPSKSNADTYKALSAQSAICLREARNREMDRVRHRLQQGSMRNKQWWSTLKAAGGDGRQCSIPVIRDANGTEHVTSQDKANCFGRFFSAKCSLVDDLNADDLPDFSRRGNSALHRVRFRPATIERHLRQLDPSKATGPDGIPARVLKHCAKALCLPLSRLFALCFQRGVQPSLWKTANVVPIHKRQSRTAMKNYRPVSLLCIVSKVMEKVVNTAIMNYLERNNLLSAHQFGFRSGLSAADLLTSLNHQWLSCINSGGAVRVLAVDIAGAFDKVSHIGVLHKLRAYGICGALHQWLTDYLAFRNLQAVVGGATSSTFPVTAGVPQGSILGPTLFLIYVNDAPEVLPRGVMPATYADDTTLFSLVANAVDAAEDCNALQAGTDALSTWGTTWRIQFEPTKSQAMTISRHRQPLPIAPLRFGGVAVEEVTTLRLLGVTFDNTMNFGQHLRSVTLRATQRIGFLRKASPVLDPPGRLTAYKGFVRPLMEYCPLVWNGAAPSHLARLDRVQKRALSLIGPGAVVDSLALRRTISGLCVLFKLMCGARLPCMAELLPPPADYANPRTRRQLQAAHGHCFQLKQTLPSRSHNTILQSFPNAHIPIWNSLPSSVLQEAPCLRSLQSFKSKSYKHLLKKDWLWATQAYP